ncbi:MAG: metallophosphoesterase [Spirochaetota bacterium]
MRILIVSDIHGASKATALIAGQLSEIDLILIAGDITDFGGERAGREVLDPLTRAGIPIAAVSGNCDRDGVRIFLSKAGYSVEGRSRTLCGLRLAGAGGGLFRQGLTPFEATEDELEDSIRAALSYDEASAAPLVVLTHTPPAGTKLDRRRSTHVGSQALGSILAERSPILWISGHIHESRSVSTKGGATLINPGPLHDGFYATATVLDKDGVVSIEAELRDLQRTR